MNLEISFHKSLFPEDLTCHYTFTKSITGILGPSGIGKTTLLKVIAGLTPIENGKIIFNNVIWQDTAKNLFLPTYQREIGFVMQDLALFPQLTVEENIRFGEKTAFHKNKTYPKKSFISLIEGLELTEFLNQKPAFLSGGQKQRVALARALYANPTLLLLDEPFNGLDETMRKKAISLTKKIIQERQVPTIVISHHQDEIFALTSEVINFNQIKKAP